MPVGREIGPPPGRGNGGMPPERLKGGGMGKPPGPPRWPWPPGWLCGNIGLLWAWPSAAYDDVIESMTD